MAVNEHRRRRREPARAWIAQPGTATEDDPARITADHEQGSLLWDAADRILNETQRTALWLRYAEDLRIKDIARVLGKTSIAVRVILFRARDALAAHARTETSSAVLAGPTPEDVGESVEVKEELAGDLAC